MISLSFAQKENIGFQYVMDALQLNSPYGEERARQLRPFTREQKPELLRQLDNVRRVMEGESACSEDMSRMLRVFMTVKNVRPTAKRILEVPLNEIELFEIKRFLLKTEEMAGPFAAVQSVLNLEGIALEDTTPALDLLDPEHNRVAAFFIGDHYSKALQNIRRKKRELEEQLRRMGMKDEKDFTCACYFDEVGNIPEKGEILSWAESSAVVYANSVLGARCNRNSGIIDVMGSMLGYVPYFGLLTDEGRKATWVVEVKTTKKPEAQLLGSAIGMKVMEDVPYIRGLDAWLGTELNKDNKAYLKDFGAATASNGAVGLYHIEHLTPEAVEQGDALIAPGAQVYVVDDAELERVKASYPVIWKNPNAKPKLAFIGCPHLTMDQLIDWTKKLEEGLKASGRDKLAVPTVLTTAPPVLEEFNKGPYAYRLKKTGAILSYICPLMYMNNPLSKSMPVITCSNKLRTYTSAKFYSEDEIVGIITGKETK